MEVRHVGSDTVARGFRGGAASWLGAEVDRLRVILDSKGSFSTVNGEKTPIETGDVVLTPGWSWHGHGHDGDEPAYWFDGLDVPLTHLLEPMFFEEHPQKYEKVERVVQTSPFRFTRADIARRLDAAEADGEGFHGPRVTLEAPSMPPMGLAMERLTAGTNIPKFTCNEADSKPPTWVS